MKMQFSYIYVLSISKHETLTATPDNLPRYLPATKSQVVPDTPIFLMFYTIIIVLYSLTFVMCFDEKKKVLYDHIKQEGTV